MIIGIISEDKTDCLALEKLITRISTGSHTFHHCHKDGKSAIVHKKKDFVNLLMNFKCDKVAIVRDSDGRSTSDTIQEINSAYATTPIYDRIFISLAVEELEAWLLGDINAVIDFYDLPSGSATSFASRPDNIKSPKECLKNYVERRADSPIQYITSHAEKILHSADIGAIYSSSPSFASFHDAVKSNIG